MRWSSALCVAVLCAAALACGEREARSARPVVAVSVAPQRWFVKRLAGDAVEVQVMLAAGASETAYEPALIQIEAASRASLYFGVGHPRFPFEQAWLDALLSGREGVPRVAIAAPDESDAGDPHLWLSARRMRAVLPGLAAALAELLPGERQAIGERRAALDLELLALDQELRARFAAADGRRFLVLHPAWGSLAEDYDLVQLAIEGEGKEPGVRDLERLITEARSAGVRRVLVQPQSDPAPARLVAEAIGAELVALDPFREDWDEAMRAASHRIAEALVP